MTRTRANQRSNAPPCHPPLRRRVAFALGLLHAALMVAAFSPVDIWPAALLAPAPLVWVALRADRPGRAGFWAALGASAFWAFEQRWIAGVAIAGLPLLIAYLSLQQWLFVWAVGRGARAWPRVVGVWAAVAWVGVEFLRGEIVWHGYPWYLVGHPLLDAPFGPAVASAAGAYWASLLVSAVGCAVGAWAAGARGRGGGPLPDGRGSVGTRHSLTVGMIVVAIALWSACGLAPGPERGGEYRVAVVQTNVPQSVRGTWPPLQRLTDLDSFIAMTIEAAREGPDLIVWPETMFPGESLADEDAWAERAARIVWREERRPDPPEWERIMWRGLDGDEEPTRIERAVDSGEWLVVPSMAAYDTLLVWQAAIGVPMLVGADGYEGLRIEADEKGVRPSYQRHYNSAFVLHEGRVTPQRYDKLHLTPFGEVMPYISAWPWLERTMLRIGVGASGMSFDLSPGRASVVLRVPRPGGGEVRAATPICFEATVARVCRRLVYAGGERQADLMVQLTNEGWFGRADSGRAEHLRLARWRCAELGTPMVRAANTGISAAIDPRGKPLAEMPSNTEGVLVVTLPLGAGGTIYARVGDAAGWVSLALTLAGLGWTATRGRRGRNFASPSADSADQ